MSKAIVTDMVLEEVMALFERRVVTPSTLFAANSLAQAVILHDTVVLGMVGAVGAKLGGGLFVEGQFAEIGIAGDTLRRPAITESGFTISDESPYAKAPLTHWLAPDQFSANVSVEAEASHLSVVLDYLRARKLSDLTAESALEDHFGVRGGRKAQVVNPAAFKRFNEDVLKGGGKALTANDLTVVRDLSWLAAAGITVAWANKYEIYHALLERPLYAGQLPRPGGPLELVGKLTDENSLTEFWAEDLVLPPFFGMVVSDPQFSLEDFWQLLWASRERHEPFRQAIGEFELAVYAASTQRELRGILQAHRQSWQALIARQQYRAEHRLLYTVSDAAASLGKSVLKELTDADRAEKKISRTGGLVQLWDDIGGIAPAARAAELLGHHFGSIPDARAWSQIRSLVNQLESAAGR